VADRNVTESISASLEDFGSLSVKSLNEESVSTYETADEIKIIGRAGNVRAILTGFTRAIGDKQEVSFRLLDATSGEPILISSTEWGINAQDGETRRGFGRMIAGALSPQRPSASIDPGLSNHVAKEAIEAGRYLSLRYTIEDLDRAITLFQKAIEVAPGSSLAHAYLAFAATARTHYVADWSYLTMGRAAAQKAIELDPISGQAHRALGSVYYQEGQFKNALEQGLRTIECGNLNAKSIRFVGLTFAQIGRLDKSIAWYRLASQVEGTPGDVDFLIGDCLAKLGDDELAVAAYTRSAELQPTQSQAWTGLCHLRILQGDFQTARNLCRAGKWNQSDLGDGKAIAAQIEFLSRDFATADRLYSDLAAADPEGGGAFYGLMSYESALGRIKLARGQTENGNHLLRRCLQRERAAVAREPENPEAFYRLAAVESSLGELERGLDYLEMSMKLGFIDKRSLLIDPRFDALHTNPRFARIIQNLSARLTEMKIAVEKRKLIATNHE
jgi:tetratricopeptide (TPR) repeat protein